MHAFKTKGVQGVVKVGTASEATQGQNHGAECSVKGCGRSESPDTAPVGAEADDGGGGALPAAALVVKPRATATSRGSYVVVLLAER